MYMEDKSLKFNATLIIVHRERGTWNSFHLISIRKEDRNRKDILLILNNFDMFQNHIGEQFT